MGRGSSLWGEAAHYGERQLIMGRGSSMMLSEPYNVSAGRQASPNALIAGSEYRRQALL
jgi:hypothetical protein